MRFIAAWLTLAVLVGVSLCWASDDKLLPTLKNAVLLSSGSLLLAGLILSPILILG